MGCGQLNLMQSMTEGAWGIRVYVGGTHISLLVIVNVNEDAALHRTFFGVYDVFGSPSSRPARTSESNTGLRDFERVPEI